MQCELISVIVPIYNVESYLSRCLNSIRNQNYENIEVLLINDGSTDDSRIIAEEFTHKDKRFILLDKENGGLSSGRNYGLKFAHGEFVCFIDSDDFVFEDYISSLRKGFGDQDDIVIADYVIYDIKTKKSYIHGCRFPDMYFQTEDEKKKLLLYLFNSKYPVMSVWKNMYRMSFLKKFNLEFTSERLVYAEDLLFHVEAYTLARRVHIIPDIVFNHLVILGSLSQGYRKRYFEMKKELFKCVLKVLEQFYDEEFVNEYLKKRPEIIGSSMFHLCKCKWKEALNNIRQLLLDDFVVDTYKENYSRTGLFRYWLLYKIGKLRNSYLIVLSAKTMQATNPIYRKVQKKNVYSEKVVQE